MNRKIMILMVVAVAMLPIFGILGMSSDQEEVQSRHLSIPDTNKMVTVHSFDEVAFTLPELVSTSELIIKGSVLNVTSFEKKVDLEHKMPWIFSIATVQVQDVLKGEIGERIIRVQLHGGETEERIALSEGHDIKDAGDVIMFLEKDSESIYGSNYALVSQISSMYLIDDDVAKHYYEEKSLSVDSLKASIDEVQKGLN